MTRRRAGRTPSAGASSSSALPGVNKAALGWGCALAAVGAVAIFFGSAAVGYTRGHSLAGLGWGLLTGFFLTVGFLVIAAAGIAALADPARAAPKQPTPRASLEPEVAAILAELEAVRLQTGRRVERREAWMIPIGVAVGVAVWVSYWVSDADRAGVMDLVAFGFLGGVVGNIIATARPISGYEQLYKARVLPKLTPQFGALVYRRPARPDVKQLRELMIFKYFDHAEAKDGIAGDYRGLEVSVTQLRLSRVSHDGRETIFRGLLISIVLKNPLLGFTAVADEGWFGALAAALSGRGVQRVGLEDPQFERVYQVYSSDQVMARALLTPDFMERLMALNGRRDFGRPVLVAQGSLLTLALPRTAGRDFFQAPDFVKPADDADVIAAMRQDIEAILRLVDAVIDLDDATRSGAVQSVSERRRTRRGDGGNRHNGPV